LIFDAAGKLFCGPSSKNHWADYGMKCAIESEKLQPTRAVMSDLRMRAVVRDIGTKRAMAVIIITANNNNVSYGGKISMT